MSVRGIFDMFFSSGGTDVRCEFHECLFNKVINDICRSKMIFVKKASKDGCGCCTYESAKLVMEDETQKRKGLLKTKSEASNEEVENHLILAIASLDKSWKDRGFNWNQGEEKYEDMRG